MMIRFEKISLKDLRKYIQLAFDGDTELAEKYHEVNIDIPTCVRETEKRIKETSKELPLVYYKCFYWGR